MASTLPTSELNMLSLMPSPHGKNSLCFRGKDIEDFLMEYEHFATHASLTEEVKCQEIYIYFSKKERHVLNVLDSYAHGDWRALKQDLCSLYTSLTDKRTYQPRDIQCFITKKRKITKLIDFDTYHHEFLVISASLEAWNALSGYDHCDYFWSGIQLTSLQDALEVELKYQNYWTDLTLPLPMN